MLKFITRLKSNLLFDKIPLLNSIFFFFFITFVFNLETVVSQVDTQIFIILNVLLSIVIYGESQISRIEESNTRTTVIEEIATNVKLLFVQQKRFYVVLNQSILLQLSIFCLSLLLIVVGIELRLIVDHVIQGKFS